MTKSPSLVETFRNKAAEVTKELDYCDCVEDKMAVERAIEAYEDAAEIAQYYENRITALEKVVEIAKLMNDAGRPTGSYEIQLYIRRRFDMNKALAAIPSIPQNIISDNKENNNTDYDDHTNKPDYGS